MSLSQNHGLSVSAWSTFTTILMNVKSTKTVLLFLEKNQIDKSLLKNEIIDGILFALQHKKFFYADKECVKNVLIFLEIEENLVNQLLIDFLTKKSLQVIIDFLQENRDEVLKPPPNYKLMKSFFWNTFWNISQMGILMFCSFKAFPSNPVNLKESYAPLCTEVMRLPSVFEISFSALESMILYPGFTRSFSFNSLRRTVSYPGSFPCIARIPSDVSVVQNENVILTESNPPNQDFQEVELLNEEGFTFFQETTVSQLTESTESNSSASESSSLENESSSSDKERPSSSQRLLQKQKPVETVSRSNSESHVLDFFNSEEYFPDVVGKSETEEKKSEVFQPTRELDRTITGFGRRHQLNRTFDPTIHSFVPTHELDRTVSSLEKVQIGKSSSGNVEEKIIPDNVLTTTENLESTDKNFNAVEKSEETSDEIKNPNLNKELTKREKLNLQKEHGFDKKSLKAKASQRIIYLEKPTPKRADNVFESNPGVKLYVNEGKNHYLNMNTSVVPYNKTKLASEHFKKRIGLLSRTQEEAKTVYTNVESQFDHSTGKNAHENYGTEYHTAKTVGLSKPIHEAVTTARFDVEKEGSSATFNALQTKMTPQDFSDIRQMKDEATFLKLPKERFRETGAPPEAYVRASQEAHESDRTQMSTVQRRLGLSPSEHTLYARVTNLNISDFNQCKKKALHLEGVPTKYLNTSKLAKDAISLFDRLLLSQEFSTGARDKLPANSVLGIHIDRVMDRSRVGKNILFKALQDKGISPETISTYLEDPNTVTNYREGDFFRYQKPLRNRGLPNSTLDVHGEEIRIDQSDMGRHQVIPSHINYRLLNSQRIK